jgi:uncharacterized protein YggE
MRLSVSSAFAGVLLLAAARVDAQTPSRSDVSEIATSGRGEIHVAPDRATVLITIETHASAAAAASSANSEITMSTIKAVKAAATAQDTVTTESYMVMPDYQKNKPSGFQTRNTVRVRLHDVSYVGAVVDAALAAGATQIPQVQFTSSASLVARRQAIRLAVAEARMDAEALADAAGGSVGKLLSVTTGGNFGVAGARLESVVVTGMATSTGGYVPPPIIPNDVVVSATVNARWEFLPRRAP